MTVDSKKAAGENLVREVFGAGLYQQGRGYYVALEFFAIVRGIIDAGLGLFPDDKTSKVAYRRRSHDFARRLVADPATLGAGKEHLRDRALDTLRSLLEGLEVPVPGKKNLSFQNRHFFPYVGDLIHYDAVERRGKISIEQYTYRGGGGLVYRILWEDPDTQRLGRAREALRALVEKSPGPLGRLARALSDLDQVKPAAEPFDDARASSAVCLETPWVELLRSGLDGILSRKRILPVQRIDAMMIWLPFCIAMHQLSVARGRLGQPQRALLTMDAMAVRSPVRGIARENLDEALNCIARAMESVAHEKLPMGLAQKRPVWRDSPRSFFSGTLYAAGALNAYQGSRYLRLCPQLLETIVVALVPGEIELKSFYSKILFERTGLVLDGRSAAESGLTGRVDRAEFERNEAAIEKMLRELGMLREYSDATKMVGLEAR